MHGETLFSYITDYSIQQHEYDFELWSPVDITRNSRQMIWWCFIFCILSKKHKWYLFHWQGNSHSGQLISEICPWLCSVAVSACWKRHQIANPLWYDYILQRRRFTAFLGHQRGPCRIFFHCIIRRYLFLDRRKIQACVFFPFFNLYLL